MKKEAIEPEAEGYPLQVPPEWQVNVRRVLKEDGRYLIYYEFSPSPAAPETALQAEESGEKRES